MGPEVFFVKRQAFLGSIVVILLWMSARLSLYHTMQRRQVLSDYAPGFLLEPSGTRHMRNGVFHVAWASFIDCSWQ